MGKGTIYGRVQKNLDAYPAHRIAELALAPMPKEEAHRPSKVGGYSLRRRLFRLPNRYARSAPQMRGMHEMGNSFTPESHNLNCVQPIDARRY